MEALKILKKLQTFGKKGLGSEKNLRDVWQKFKLTGGKIRFTNGHFLTEFSGVLPVEDGVYNIDTMVKEPGYNYPDFETIYKGMVFTHRVIVDRLHLRLDEVLYTLASYNIYLNHVYFDLIGFILDTFQPDEILFNVDEKFIPVTFKSKDCLFAIMQYNFDKCKVETL